MVLNIWSIEVLLLIQFQTIVSSKYIFIFQHCRHGARGLSKLNAKGKDYIGEPWMGDSELSSVGLRQHYLLGTRMKNKYKEIISDVYNPRELILYATNSNRTIMSGLAQLQGMFPKNAQENTLSDNQLLYSTPPFDYNDDMRMVNHIQSLGNQPLPNYIQSVPIHILNSKEKVFQFDKNDGCPPIKTLRKENEKKAVFQEYVQKFNESYGEQMLKILKKKDKDTFAQLKHVSKLASAFVFDYIDGRELKKFTKTGIDLDKFFKFCLPYPEMHSIEGQAGDSEGNIGMASSSVLMRLIITHIDRRIEADMGIINEQDPPKLMLVSAHDGTLVSAEDFLKKLFKSPSEYPSFASNQIFEITRDDNIQPKSHQDYKVKILFNDKEKLLMSYKQFREDVLNKAWTLEETGLYCGFIEDTWKIWKISTFVLSVISGTLLIGLVLMLVFKCKDKPIEIENKPLVQ